MMAVRISTALYVLQCLLTLSGAWRVGPDAARDLGTDGSDQVSLLQFTFDQVEISKQRRTSQSINILAARTPPSEDAIRMQTYLCCCIVGISFGLTMMTRTLWEAKPGDISDGKPSEKNATRLPLLDNAKVLAMWLVLTGHLCQYVLGPDSAWNIRLNCRWNVGDYLGGVLPSRLNRVHMPLFCLVSGLCSRGPPSVKRFRALVTQIALPLVIWIFIFMPFIEVPFTNLVVARQRFDAFLWFLPALFLWRVLAYTCWHQLRSSLVLLSSMVISCCGGYLIRSLPNNTNWSFLWNGPIGFLPIFAVGYVLPLDAILSKVSGMGVLARCAAACFILTWICVFDYPFVFHVWLPEEQIPWHIPVHALHNFNFYLYWTWYLTRMALDILTCLVFIVFVIPREQTPLTWVGQHTLYAYMFNKFGICAYCLLLGALQQHVALPIPGSSAAAIAIAVFHALIAFLILLLLTSWPWRWIFKWCVEPESFALGVYSFLCDRLSQSS